LTGKSDFKFLSTGANVFRQGSTPTSSPGAPKHQPPNPAIFEVLSAINSIPWLHHHTADTLRAERLLSLSNLNPSTSPPSAPLKVYVDSKNVEGCVSVRVSHVDQEAWFVHSKKTEPVATDIDLTGLGVSEEFTMATSENPFVQVRCTSYQ
jgi:hypothetical protein